MAGTAEYYKKNPEARRKRQKQQAKYNKTAKGKELISNAQKLRNKLKIPKGSKMDAAHYKGSKTMEDHNIDLLIEKAEQHDPFTT
ncbi:MAG: hypothetical protein CM15mV75_580 [uncultured marine virus]|nr:MAG: hypothetical protein CM15mV75_580 [uncultured marine virus]